MNFYSSEEQRAAFTESLGCTYCFEQCWAHEHRVPAGTQLVPVPWSGAGASVLAAAALGCLSVLSLFPLRSFCPLHPLSSSPLLLVSTSSAVPSFLTTGAMSK